MGAARRTSAAPARRVPAGVAAGHPATAEAGAEVLRAGGSAADAAVAAVLAACVAETVFTGLGGGGFATYYDAATGKVTCLDFFVAVPGLGSDRDPAPMTVLEVAFGGVPQAFSIGAPSVAVPGVPAGCAEVHRRWGRLPWPDLVAPALALAGAGVLLPPTHATVLDLIAGGLAVGEGAAVYAPGGTLATGGDTLAHPGLDRMLALLAAEGPAAFYRGSTADALVDVVRAGGGVLTSADLAAYAVHEVTAGAAPFAGGTVVRARTDLNRCRDTFAALPSGLGTMTAPARAVAVAGALGGPDLLGDTTNVSVVDGDGNACVVTTTMGLGSGVWVPGTGVHLNSMLGEGELLIGPQVPGARMGSMMCPLVVTDPSGLVAAAGAAGASRIRTALVHTLVGTIALGLPAAEAVAGPRTHPVGPILHVEPGLRPEVVAGLRRSGWRLRAWPRRDAYFGGASVVGRTGAGADPRRDGAVAVP
ncbi:MAG TPA: gamma-glutamyltransferase [Mycobacteriales bacterium]|nr:gamma-glutamyltransferase [Mycobacteriales bacterium]